MGRGAGGLLFGAPKERASNPLQQAQSTRPRTDRTKPQNRKTEQANNMQIKTKLIWGFKPKQDNK